MFRFILSAFIFAAIFSYKLSAQTGPSSAADYVLLEAVGSGGITVFYRTNTLTGQRESGSGTNEYSPPAGRKLVITDIDWQYQGGTAGRYLTLRLMLNIPNASGTPIIRRALESTAILGNDGGGGEATSLHTGIVIYPQTVIRMDVTGTGATGTGKIQHVLIRGFLIN